MKFTEYQDQLPLEIRETVQIIHAELSAMGFTEEIKEAKSGPVLSYMKDKKVLLNYVYRKSGIKVRLYAAGTAACEDCLAVLPDSMKAELKNRKPKAWAPVVRIIACSWKRKVKRFQRSRQFSGMKKA